MIAVVPMMGLGERFSKSGYSEYKPFVKVNTEMLIKKVLRPLINSFDKVYVVCNEEVANQLTAIFFESIEIIKLNSPTKGAADTLLKACTSLPSNQQIACIDCDTIFNQSAIDKAKSTQGNFLLTFYDDDRTGLYSYVNVLDDKVVDIQEKKAISNIASAGFYVFRNSSVLEACCLASFSHNTELYVSKAIGQGIQQGEEFTTVDVTNEFHCCGTPFQLKSYAKSELGDQKLTISFDIDGTLVYDLYNTPFAIEKNVKFCNEAYRNGHTIILHTARGMLSKNKNKELIEASRPRIEQVLSDLGILYHELVLMKPYADVYIDDKAIAAHRDLQKEIGLYLFEDHAARSHNTIVVKGDRIIKSGLVSGECFYYQNIPTNVLDLFPKVHSCTNSTIELQRITQPTYSSLLLSGRLSKADLDVLLSSLTKLHCTQPTGDCGIDGLWAYHHKVASRFDEFSTLYSQLGVDVSYYKQLASTICQSKLGTIHGDSVLTNIFDGDGACKFIDMRGVWDNKLTTCGDIYYDHAKVMQSLWGYDHALHNEPIQADYLQSLREYYTKQLTQIHPEIDLKELQVKVELLYISLIPFHKEDLDRCNRFLQIVANLKK